MPLKIKRGFFRYKCVIRSPITEEILGYLEGSGKFIDLFRGETFYMSGNNKVYCTFENKRGELENLYLSEIDTSEYDLVRLDKKLEVKQLFSQPTKPPIKKKRTSKPTVRRYYEKPRKMWKVIATLEDGTRKHLAYCITEAEAIDVQNRWTEENIRGMTSTIGDI